MKRLYANTQQVPHVTAFFRDGAHSFLLSEGATLAELATHVEDLGASHEGAAIAIHVQFESSARGVGTAIGVDSDAAHSSSYGLKIAMKRAREDS